MRKSDAKVYLMLGGLFRRQRRLFLLRRSYFQAWLLGRCFPLAAMPALSPCERGNTGHLFDVLLRCGRREFHRSPPRAIILLPQSLIGIPPLPLNPMSISSRLAVGDTANGFPVARSERGKRP